MVVMLLAACSYDEKVSTSNEEVTSEGATSEGADEEGAVSEDADTNESTNEETTDATKDLDIVWVHSGAANQSEQRAYAGFLDYLDDQGWNWSVSEANSEDSGDKVARNISDAVAKGCDAIITSMTAVSYTHLRAHET